MDRINVGAEVNEIVVGQHAVAKIGNVALRLARYQRPKISRKKREKRKKEDKEERKRRKKWSASV